MSGKGKAKLKAGCGILAVFSVGFLAGMLVFVLFLARVIPLSEGWKGEESQTFIVNRLAKRLKMSEEQIDAVRPFVESALEERHLRREDYTRDDIEIVRRSLEQVRDHLDPEQAKRAERAFSAWRKGKERYLGPPSAGSEGPGPDPEDPEDPSR